MAQRRRTNPQSNRSQRIPNRLGSYLQFSLIEYLIFLVLSNDRINFPNLISESSSNTKVKRNRRKKPGSYRRNMKYWQKRSACSADLKQVLALYHGIYRLLKSRLCSNIRSSWSMIQFPSGTNLVSILSYHMPASGPSFQEGPYWYWMTLEHTSTRAARGFKHSQTSSMSCLNFEHGKRWLQEEIKRDSARLTQLEIERHMQLNKAPKDKLKGQPHKVKFEDE
ncbi:hypothetical protein LguiA_029673 [Lonicera macranthoides]